MLTETTQYHPFQPSECDCFYCQLPPWDQQSARTLRAKKPRRESDAPPRPARGTVQWGYNLSPRYLGSLAKQFSPFEQGAMEPQVCGQVELMGLSARSADKRVNGMVGLQCDFELTLALGRVLCDGLPTLDVLHLAWAPYAEAQRYWKQHGRDNSLPILLALEQYACSVKRRLRLVDVKEPRLHEYFCRLRGYTPQSNNAYCLLDTVGLDPELYEK